MIYESVNRFVKKGTYGSIIIGRFDGRLFDHGIQDTGAHSEHR